MLLNTNREHWAAPHAKAIIEKYYTRIAQLEGAVPNQVTGNHDTDTLRTRLQSAQAMRAAYVVLASLPGTFYTWQGDVLGRPNIDMPDALKKDGDIGGRDGERVPMQWDASYNGGFSDAPFEELWLPTVDANVYRGDNVAAQQQDATSPYRLVKETLTLRRDDPALHNGELRMLHTENDAVLAFARSDPNNTRRQIISVVNFSPNTTTVYIPDVHMNRGRVLLSSTTGRGSNVTVDITRPIQLEPDTAYLIESLV